MGTKNNPGKFDCYTKALLDELMFILLEMVDEARECAKNMRK